MDRTEIIDRYCSAWQDRTEAERAEIIAPFWNAESIYLDPSVFLVGPQALIEHIERVQSKYPGSTTIRTSVLDEHHHVARFHWAKILVDGTKLPEGIDFAEFNEDGSISRIIGFFGPLAREE